MKTPIRHDAIQHLVPHTDSMCLIDRVIFWDQAGIVCETDSHRSIENPLRFQNRLSATAGIEYASQAMAIHGNLTQKENKTPRIGLIGSLSNIVFYTDQLDDKFHSLVIEANLISQSGATQLYDFMIKCAAENLISGEILVLLMHHE